MERGLARGRAARGRIERALETLCHTYWYPLYAYVRRQGKSPHDAQDLTQEFFSRLLESSALENVRPEKGRFRSFLIASLNHFLANDWKHERRQKRGGGHVHISIEEEAAEGRYLHEPTDRLTPEKLFDRRWAETLLQRVLDRLQKAWEQRPAAISFAILKPYLLGSDDDESFGEAAQRLGVTEASLKWAMHKLRQRYGEIFREEIAHTVSSPQEVEDEIRHLISVMAG